MKGEKFLDVRPAPPEETVYRHTCEDGHEWTAQADGTVSPSYGLGGTKYSWPGYDAATCPEPEWADLEGDRYVRAVKCPGCGVVRAPHDLLSGLSSSPWLLFGEAKASGHEHTAPPPVCLKPAVKTMQWMEVKKMLWREKTGKHSPGWTRSWVPIDEAGAKQEGTQLDLFDEETRAKARAMVAARG